MSVKKVTISLDDEVFQRIEQMRGKRTQFRSGYINAAIREKLGLPARGAPTST